MICEPSGQRSILILLILQIHYLLPKKYMSKSRRLLIGVLSMLPLLLVAVYTFMIFSIFISAVHHHGQVDALPEIMMNHMVAIVVVGLSLGLFSLALLIYFIVHVINNPAIDSTERLVWILVFIFAVAKQ